MLETTSWAGYTAELNYLGPTPHQIHRSNADSHGNKHQQLLLPTSLHDELLKGVHDQCGHKGLERTEQLVHECCWWPGLHNDVKKYRNFRPIPRIGQFLQ